MTAPQAESTTTEQQPNTNPTEQQPEGQGDPESLGDGGKKALEAERRARKAAEKTAQTLKTRLDELDAEKLSKEEQAAKKAKDAEDRAAKAEAEAQRWRIAAKYGISDEDAQLFLTGGDEDTLTRQAERFVAITPKQPAKGTHVPGVGNQPPTPPSLAEQIAAANAAGDTKMSLALKAQQTAELLRNQK